MKVMLPKIIEMYVQASNGTDLNNMISCFADSATVVDEGETLIGHKAISKWFTETSNKYQFKAEPIGIEEKGEDFIMRAKVSGNFSGSPVVLDYHFKINLGLIQNLRIT